MATAYEVSFHVRTDGSVTAIQDVLTQTLHGTDRSRSRRCSGPATSTPYCSSA
jgi:hypothetical protein